MSEERGPTPEHHHYVGLNCGHRGRVCTSPKCWWAIDVELLTLHAECEDE